MTEESSPDNFTVFIDKTEIDDQRRDMGRLFGYGAVPTRRLPQLTVWVSKLWDHLDPARRQPLPKATEFDDTRALSGSSSTLPQRAFV